MNKSLDGVLPCIKILLVDDDEDDYFLTSVLLEEVAEIEFKIEWVSDFDTALKQIQLHEYDIYLFDYQLGPHTGIELLEYVLNSGDDDTPVILLTGQRDKEVDKKAMEIGAADYLIKGTFDASMLERSIRYALERRKIEDRVKYLAFHDELTNLPNRTLFEDRLKQVIMHGERFARNFAIMFLDLDNFKGINDNFGHNAGDELLQQVSDRLQNCIRSSDSLTHEAQNRQSDTVARQGGDEFIILLSEINQAESAAKAAERILSSLTDPIVIDGQMLYISVSIGIAIYPLNGKNISDLMKNADAAMYQAKQAGKNTYRFYDEGINVSAANKLKIEQSVRAALKSGGFNLVHHPRVDTANKKIISCESLIRLNDKELGAISPADFIPIAEEVGLIIPIGEWVMRTACREAATWQKETGQTIGLSVNVSSKQLHQKNFVEILKSALNDSSLPPHLLEIELTEGVLIEDSEEIISKLNQVAELGVKISIDDFGTGYSSLVYLKKMPIDVLKIDREFVKDITKDDDNEIITKTIIIMAKSLQLDIVAEGVETQEQLNFLVENDCPTVQGFLFSKPLELSDLIKFIKEF